MYCRALTYGNMLEVENDDSSDWNKRTVRYILENYKKVKKMVRIMGKGLLEYQVDDIMSDVAVYFKNANDYDIERAYNESTDSYIPIEGYIAVGIKHCIQRYKTERYGNEKNVVHTINNNDEDSKERDVFDTIQDNSSLDEMNNIGYDLDTTLSAIRSMRYKYGIDIYMIIYIRLLTNSNSEKYFKILEAIGVSKKELNDTEKKLSKEFDMQCLIKAICLNETERLISSIEGYVYGCKQLKKAVNQILEY